jgi:hypothetical protein
MGLVNRIIPTQPCLKGEIVGRRPIHSSPGYPTPLEKYEMRLKSASFDLNFTIDYQLQVDTISYRL